MSCILNFLDVKITANGKMTFFGKLYEVSSNPTECVKHTKLLLSWFIDVIRILLTQCYLFSNMFSHRLRSNRVPTFVINHDTTIKFAKKKISLLPELFEVWLLGDKFILKVISFRSTISIKIILMWLKNCFCSFDNH